MEQKVTLASVLRRFKVTALDKPEDVPLLCELILRPRDEIRLRLNLKQWFELLVVEKLNLYWLVNYKVFVIWSQLSFEMFSRIPSIDSKNNFNK